MPDLLTSSECLNFNVPSFSSLDAGHQQMLSMWQMLHVNMRSLLSWQYLTKDFTQIRSWNITMVGFNPFSKKSQIKCIEIIEFLPEYLDK